MFIDLFPYFTSLIVNIILSIFINHYRDNKAVYWLFIATLCQIQWTAGYIMELLVNDLGSKIFWDNFQFIGSSGYVLVSFMFTMSFINRRSKFKKRISQISLVFYIVLIIYLFIHPSSKSVRLNPRIEASGNLNVLLYDYGWVVWIYVVFTYLLALIIIIDLTLQFIRLKQRRYKIQTFIILSGILFPYIISVLGSANILFYNLRDTTPLTFVITNILIIFGLFRYGSFDILPVARREIVEQMNNGMVVFNNEGYLLDFNHKFEQLLVKIENIHTRTHVTSVFQDYPQIIKFYDNEKQMEMVISLLQQDEVHHIQINKMPLHNLYNELSGWIFLFEDITRNYKKQLQIMSKGAEWKEKFETSSRELIESERKYKLVLENAPVLIQIVNREGIITYINHNGTNFRKEDMLGKHVSDFFDTKNGEIVDKNLQSVFHSNLPIESEVQSVDKGYYISRFVKVDENTAIHLAVEITPLKEAEKELQIAHEQLFQVQKLEAIGRIATGVAHDFNNLLTVITLNCNNMMDEIQPEDPFYINVENILEVVKSSKAITNDLLLYSRKRVMNLEIVDLNAEVEKLYQKILPMVPANVENELKLCLQNIFINVDKIRFEQVIINIVMNALDAMSDGGNLVISTAIEDKNRNSLIRVNQSKKFGVITISDNGVGMDSETQKKLFEPFFTTKDERKGTGLGLATSNNIVEQCEGFIEVSSELGKGTTMSIYFPFVQPEISIKQNNNLPRTKERLKLPQNQRVRILLVEDDANLKKIMIKVLSQSGYEVVDFDNPQEALDAFRKLYPEIEIIISDYGFPSMSGIELIEELQEIKPNIRSILITGDNSVIDNFRKSEIKVLPKPFDFKQIVLEIKSLLSS